MLNGPLNWGSRLIGPNSSAYFEAELSGTNCTSQGSVFPFTGIPS